MKKLIYIFICLLTVACKSETKSMNSNMAVDEVAEITVDETSDLPDKFKVIEETFEFKDLTSQKLQELYDLLIIQNQHPEFNEGIKPQIESYTNDSIEIANDLEAVSIKNIQLIESIIYDNDSTQKIKISYDIVSQELIIKDSIFAEIKSERILLDNQERVSNKIRFTKK